jgi:peptidoglycan/LPS O-acetylase OafA/YrhL
MKRIIEIDGIRGFAILLVISFHYINNQLIESTNFLGKIMAKVTSFGWVGVDLFFVLSGFLIGSVLLNNKISINYFSTFYKRRLVRIFPNYVLLITLFLFIIKSGYFDKNYFLTGNNVIPIWSYYLMIHNFFMFASQNLGNDSICITWSIGIEEQFYLIIPFVLWKLNTKWIPYLMIFIILVAIVSRMQYEHWIERYVLLSCRADSLSFGVLIAWFNYKYSLNEKIPKIKTILIFILLIVFVFCGTIYYLYADLGVYKHTFFSIIFSICILFALGMNQNFYGKILRNKILCWVGSISYSLYLFHYIILGLVHHFDGKNGIIINNSKDVLLTLIALILTFGFSYLVNRFIENPMIKIGKKFKY